MQKRIPRKQAGSFVSRPGLCRYRWCLGLMRPYMWEIILTMRSIGSATGSQNETLRSYIQRAGGFRHLAGEVAHPLHFQLCPQFGKDSTSLLPQFRRFFRIAPLNNMLCPFAQGPGSLHFDLCLSEDPFTFIETGICIILNTLIGFTTFQANRFVELIA